MSFKAHILEFINAILDAEIKAKELYQYCLDNLKEEEYKTVLSRIRDDELRHEGLAREIISLLQ